jgi:hypothetical protein
MAKDVLGIAEQKVLQCLSDLDSRSPYSPLHRYTAAISERERLKLRNELIAWGDCLAMNLLGYYLSCRPVDWPERLRGFIRRKIEAAFPYLDRLIDEHNRRHVAEPPEATVTLNNQGEAGQGGDALDTEQQGTPSRESETGNLPATKPKRSTQKGEARDKIIAALTKHHKYADDGCLNQAPISVNELARKYDVTKASASRFFKKEFGGHSKYRNVYCKDLHLLLAALKKLNDEYAVDDLFGGTPPQKGKDDED